MVMVICTRKHIVLLLFSLSIALGSYTQTTVKLVTRKIEQHWEAKEGCKVFIAAEKARISIEQSEGNTIEVELKLIAKHAELEVAQREVQYLKYNLTKKGNDYYFNNTILLPKNTSQAEARLNTIYVVKIPKGCELHILNKLGNVTIVGISNKLTINMSYGNLNVSDYKGNIDLKMKVGDIDISNSTMRSTISSEYAEIDVDKVNGSLKIESRFGKMNIVPGPELHALSIDAHKSDVYIFNENCLEFNLNIDTDYGSIKTTEGCYIKTKSLLKIEIEKDKTTEMEYQSTNSQNQITINTRFANVNLR